MTEKNCPLCGSQEMSISRFNNRDAFIVECRRCGRFGITGSMFAGISSLSAEERFRISCYTREKALTKSPVPVIYSSVNKPHELDGGASYAISWDQITNREFPERLSDRVDKSLLNLSRMAKPGKSIEFFDADNVLVYSEDLTDSSYLIGILREEGYVEAVSQNDIRLTLAGWNRVTEIERGSVQGQMSQAFVAMWFTDDLNAAWENGFAAAISTIGFKPLRIDKKQHNEKICDVIVSEINRSAFLVADFTGNRGGVYYEAGYAKGRGIPVIFTCRADHAKDLHFDTRQYNHIIWKTEQELKESLIARILATISGAAQVAR